MSKTTSEWQIIGSAAMDTAGLLIADPCYVINQKGRDPETLEINDYTKAWVECSAEFTQLNFKRGHEGAGVIVHSPHGDGCVTIWGKIDSNGRARAVYFSFDGKPPTESL